MGGPWKRGIGLALLLAAGVAWNLLGQDAQKPPSPVRPIPALTASNGHILIDGKPVDWEGMREFGSPEGLWILIGKDSVEALKGSANIQFSQDVQVKVDQDLRFRIVRMSASEVVVQISTSDRMIQTVRLGVHELNLKRGQPLELELQVVRVREKTYLQVKSAEQVLAEVPTHLRLTPERIVFAPDSETGIRAQPGEDLRIRLIRMSGIGVVMVQTPTEVLAQRIDAPPNEMTMTEQRLIDQVSHVVFAKYRTWIVRRNMEPFWVPPPVQVGIQQAKLPAGGLVQNIISNAMVPPPAPNASPTKP
jgi:hypothetical protein